MIVYTAGGFMKNSNSFELLIAHDKKIGEAYKKLCMDLINNDFEQSKVSCKNILELIKIETSMLDKMTKEELENKIATFTGGRVAEELVFGDVTTGASNDIEQATKLARAIITRYGMSEFGMVAMESLNNVYLGGDTSMSCSQETAAKIDDLVVALVQKQYEKAKNLLNSHMDKLHEISKFLYEHETITGEEFMEILNRPQIVAQD